MPPPYVGLRRVSVRWRLGTGRRMRGASRAGNWQEGVSGQGAAARRRLFKQQEGRRGGVWGLGAGAATEARQASTGAAQAGGLTAEGDRGHRVEDRLAGGVRGQRARRGSAMGCGRKAG